MPPRKSAVKRRMYCGPEAKRKLNKRKLAFFLAHQLRLQQPRPFMESALGRLPGEIRDMIYEYVLAPQSKSTKYLGVPVTAATDSDIVPAEAANATLVAKTVSAEPSQLAPAKVSCVAILQTCRQIYREAYHIFYARNSFQFDNAPDLIAFLRGIGTMRRAELVSLHIEGLVIDRLCEKDELHGLCLRLGIDSVREERIAAVRHPSLHPDILHYESARLFQECKNLSRLVLELKAEYGCFYFAFLRFRFGLESAIYLVDESHWILGLCHAVGLPPFHPGAQAHEIFRKYRDCFPYWAWGNKVRLEVEIIRDPEEVLKKGSKCWGVMY